MLNIGGRDFKGLNCTNFFWTLNVVIHSVKKDSDSNTKHSCSADVAWGETLFYVTMILNCFFGQTMVKVTFEIQYGI